MPRRPTGVPQDAQRQRFAQRLEEEGARRGWSDAVIAQRATEHRDSECLPGCYHYRIQPSTVWKIKNADPPRRVDVDEATAIAVGAFQYESIEQFLADSPLQPFSAARHQLFGNVYILAVALKDAEANLAEAETLLTSSDFASKMTPAEGPALAEIAEGFTFSGDWAAGDLTSRLAALGQRLRVIGERIAEVGTNVE